MNARNILFLLTFMVVVFLVPITSFAASKTLGVACLTPKGKIVIKEKCSKKQVKLSAANLASEVGISGLKGDKGDPGPPGVTGHVSLMDQKVVTLAQGEFTVLALVCPDSQAAAYYRCTHSGFLMDTTGSEISDDGGDIVCVFKNISGLPQTLTITLQGVCAPLIVP